MLVLGMTVFVLLIDVSSRMVRALFGVAYKKDIDDLHESPAPTIIELFQKDGVHVSYDETCFPFIGKGRKCDLQMKSSEFRDLWPV